MAKTKPIKMYPKLREELVKLCRQEWDYIAYDYLALFDNHECSAEEAQEAVGDRITHSSWNKISREDQDSILQEAIPRRQGL
jgi:hypothetical protein